MKQLQSKSVSASIGANASEVFAGQLSHALEELFVTGYDALDSGFLAELNNLSQIAKEIGFDKVSELILELSTACEKYGRYNSNLNAQAVTTALSHVYFALSFLNFGKNDNAKNMEQATGEFASDQDGMSPEFLLALEHDNDFL